MFPLCGLEGLGSIIVKLSTTKSHPILSPRCHLQTTKEKQQTLHISLLAEAHSHQDYMFTAEPERNMNTDPPFNLVERIVHTK